MARGGSLPLMVRPALQFILLWTLALLLLGSVVHATESSLACPDWPTCFGTMMPEMTGGVFWEHLHRLWAGALVLFFLAALIIVRRKLPGRTDIFRLGVAGLVLLVVQSVLGGLTVIYRLPDVISTSHLALAFIFLALVTVMLVRTGPAAHRADIAGDPGGGTVRRAGMWAACLVFVQSVVGALVRHTDSGMACPDVPLCLGRVIPPLDHPMVQLHFLHRVLGLILAAVVVTQAWLVITRSGDPVSRRLAACLGAGVACQVLLGFLSVAFRLGVPYVSAHTLLAATLLTLAVAMAARRPAAAVPA
ncbi:MAG: heme A synthase [Gemmatimonadetes bacterium]|nr:heme A synthase [Gemmatimonadota bacterium]